MISLPVQLPRLYDFNAVHQARVTINKLRELYQTMYAFVSEVDQRVVPTKVKLPVLHNFNFYNEETVTVGTLRNMYKVLYQADRPVARQPQAVAPTVDATVGVPTSGPVAGSGGTSMGATAPSAVGATGGAPVGATGGAPVGATGGASVGATSAANVGEMGGASLAARALPPVGATGGAQSKLNPQEVDRWEQQEEL